MTVRKISKPASQGAIAVLAGALFGVAAFLPGAALAGSASAPTVVELFTSQGCSSCPPANENVRALAGRSDVLTLSYGVTYWDYLGWKDTFAKETFTERQRSYVRPLGNSSPFTPQVVVNGSDDVVGNRKGQIEKLIASEERHGNAPDIEIAARRVAVSDGRAPAGGADVWLVRYDPRTIDVPVGRGENGGRTLPHRNVVHDIRRIGAWSGEAASFELPRGGRGLKTAILVQAPSGGPILSAATN